MNVATGSSTNE